MFIMDARLMRKYLTGFPFLVAFTNGNENLSFDIADHVIHRYSLENNC